MTTELSFRFPLGRVHATPWGENPNEGSVEWPPSPWRLLRALYATWRSRVPDLDPEVVLDLFDQLAEPPVFVLPRHALAHTRHYLPGPAHQQGVSTDKSKVLDTFVTVSPDDELIVRWEVDLDGSRREALVALAEHLTYLGRAESICDVEARFSRSAEGHLTVSQLTAENSTPSIALLAPTRPVEEATLTVTTTQVRSKLKRREPPQTHRLRYPRPVPGPDVLARAGARRNTEVVDTVRWSIASNARPSKYAAVAWADILRQAVFSKYGGPDKRQAPPILSGKSPEGSSAATEHRHVHWFAFGSSDDRRLSTLVAWAPDGFVTDDSGGGLDEDVLDAMANVRYLRSRGLRDVHSCAVGVEGWGKAGDIIPELAGPSRTWRSLTPFAPSRHRHNSDGDATDYYSGCIARELAWRGFDLAPPVVSVVAEGDWHRYRRHRPNKERLSQARSVVGLDLEFAEPVAGPIALGLLSHFGLGLFRPMDK